MLELPDPDDAERVADWVELELSLGEPWVSKSTLSSVVRDASGVDANENFVSDIWGHLRRRNALYSVDYFEIRGDLAARCEQSAAAILAYQVCLFFSLYGASVQRGADPKLFERMCAEAISIYFGGEVFVFGWPVLADVQTEIAERVRQVATLTLERFTEAPGTRYKDRGVDIITWRPFVEPRSDDHRTGQLVMLSQCAAGHDWRGKTRELPMKSWIQYIHWASDPMAGFAVPCVIDDDLWHDIAREVDGVVFDRVRVVNLLKDKVYDAGLRAELETWIAEQVTEHHV